MFYTIAEVAQHYGINESTLRFWEKEFDIIAPKRSDNRRKIRAYTPQDVRNIGLIYHLLKEQGLTLSGAKERLKRNAKKTGNLYDVVSRLQAIRNELSAVCRELNALSIPTDIAKEPSTDNDEEENKEPHIAPKEEGETPNDLFGPQRPDKP